jgi:Fem-1 family protein b
MFDFRYPCFQTARILLQSGAAVNAFDAVRNTPLHIIASSKSSRDQSILNLLCNANAHMDYANDLRQTPIDLAIIPDIKQLLKSRMKLSLKCLCAHLIRKKNVPFRETISTSLANFVEKH